MDFIRQLSEIEKSCKHFGDVIRSERRIFSAELEDRIRLGLQGEDAIKHYNDWMTKFGLFDMVVNV